MPTRRFERIPLAQILVGACDRTCTSAAGLCASPEAAATAGIQSIQSRYRASTELQTANTFDTKHNAFDTKHRSKC